MVRGLALSADDFVRRRVIQVLACDFELSMPAIEAEQAIVFADYFAGELKQLATMEQDGLLRMTDDKITVTPKGRLLIRNVCMVFDRYLGMPHEIKLERMRYSKTI